MQDYFARLIISTDGHICVGYITNSKIFYLKYVIELGRKKKKFGILRVFFSDFRAKTGAKICSPYQACDVIINRLRFSHSNRCESLPSHLMLLLLINNDVDYSFSYSSGGRGVQIRLSLH